jgi:hypothetical protein
VSRWQVIPSTKPVSALLLLAGVLAVAINTLQLARADDVAILPVVAIVLGVVVIVIALVGLFSKRRQPR